MAFPPGRKPRGPRRTAGIRKPDPVRFAAFRVQGAFGERAGRSLVHWAVIAVAAAGIGAGAWWPHTKPPAGQETFSLIEEEILQPPPEPQREPPPAPPDPDPPPPEPPKAMEPPPPQFGLQEDEMSGTGDLAVAAGNTLMKAAEPEVLPLPPPLPPAPVFVDQAPRILSGGPPEYPARALDGGLEGIVVALITIDTTGIVTDVIVEKSAGADFDHCVRISALGTRFHPPVRNGRKVSARFRRPYEFKLE